MGGTHHGLQRGPVVVCTTFALVGRSLTLGPDGDGNVGGEGSTVRSVTQQWTPTSGFGRVDQHGHGWGWDTRPSTPGLSRRGGLPATPGRQNPGPSPPGVGHGRRAGGHVAHHVRTVGLWGSVPPAHPLAVGPVVLRDTFLPDQQCLPVQCLWLGAAGARRHAVHVMHACPSRPTSLLHYVGLVLVHGVMRVAPSLGRST